MTRTEVGATALDGQLVARAAAGDTDAFAALYRKHHPAVYAFCRRRLSHVHDAEDCVQEAFSRAWSSLRRAGRPDDFRPWLFTIAARACHERYGDRVSVALETDSVGTSSFEDEAIDRLDDRIGGALATLAPPDRSIVWLTYDAGMPVGKVARALGLPPRHVEAKLFRARRALQAELSRER